MSRFAVIRLKDRTHTVHEYPEDEHKGQRRKFLEQGQVWVCSTRDRSKAMELANRLTEVLTK